MMQAMRAMVLERPRVQLNMRERPLPAPGPGEIVVAVTACGVCRTDLHVVDGELSDAALPVVPGHEIVGRVKAVGVAVSGFLTDDRVGLPCLCATFSIRQYWRSHRFTLCDAPVCTGSTRAGGFVTKSIADGQSCSSLGDAGDDPAIAN